MVSTDVDAVRELRAVLDEVGYSADAIAALLHLPGELRIAAGDANRADFLLDESRPLDALVRLFLLGGSIVPAAARDALGERLDLLDRTGLASIGHVAVHATALLVPHGGFVIASDAFGDADRHWVPGVQRPSDLLACVTPRGRVDRALDLGTGNGIQALLLSDHADHVVAVDVNEHALELACFNAILNGRDGHIEFRQGNFLEPVRGERFDLVVSNPPYVLSPEDAYVFRDADVRGDVMCRGLIVDIAGHLTDGGLATVMVSWPQRGDEAPAPQRWLADAGADGVVMVLAVHDALDAAMLWNTPYVADGDEFTRRVEAWRDYFAAEDIPAIGHGVVAMRRSPQALPPVTAVLPPTAPPGWRGGAQLERVVDAIVRYGRTDGPTMLALAPDVRLTEVSRPGTDGLEVTAVEIGVPDGLAFTVGLDPSGAQLVRRFATATSIEHALGSFPDLGPDARQKAVGFLADLVRLGLLVPADQN